MKRRLAWESFVLGAGGIPSWRTTLSRPNGKTPGNAVKAVVAAGQVAIVYLPGAGTLPAACDSVSRIPGSAEALSGGSVCNAGNPAANRSVAFRYS